MQDSNVDCYAKHYCRPSFKMSCMTLLSKVMHDVMYDLITERRANCYAKYLIHGVMQNVVYDIIT
jgi:hypothetical protein